MEAKQFIDWARDKRIAVHQLKIGDVEIMLTDLLAVTPEKFKGDQPHGVYDGMSGRFKPPESAYDE